MMKMKKIAKAAALGGMLLLCLSLSGCYIPPDDLAGDVNNLFVGSNNAPSFNPINFTEAPTASPTPTIVPTTNTNPENSADPSADTLPDIDWDGWASGNTNTGTAQPQQPGVGSPATTMGMSIGVSTPQPGIATITQNPGVATNTPAPTSLKRGSTGDAVKAVQQRLKDLEYYSGVVDGDFGEGTEAAVRAFQQRNGLTADGKVGSQTLAKLNSSSAIKASAGGSVGVSTPQSTAAPRATATPNLSKDLYLKDGSSGKDVRQLQERLISLGWLTGEADGTYGGATEAAIIAFQKKTSGLYDDGVAGPGTLKAVYSNSAAKSSSPVASVGIKLESGSEGEAVRALQKRLSALGYLSGSADGSYGEKTRAAVIAFQSNSGLKVDGIAGTGTLNAIYSQNALKAGQSGTGSGSEGGSGTLQEGDKSDAVTRLQQALKNQGYYNGSVDGSYGSGTVAAVKAFQQANGLRADGKAGPATQRALFGTSASGNYSTLRPGDEGTAVSNMQRTLYELGYYDGQADGIYSSLTSDAVRAFQGNNSLKVDGVAGEETLKKLYSSSARAAGAKATSFKKLQKGDSGSEVSEMQNALKSLGYLSQITGVFDDETYWAVKSFQERNNLNSDGVAGNDTLTKLYSGSAVSNR